MNTLSGYALLWHELGEIKERLAKLEPKPEPVKENGLEQLLCEQIYSRKMYRHEGAEQLWDFPRNFHVTIAKLIREYIKKELKEKCYKVEFALPRSVCETWVKIYEVEEVIDRS
jgi:hypothetical protein